MCSSLSSHHSGIERGLVSSDSRTVQAWKSRRDFTCRMNQIINHLFYVCDGLILFFDPIDGLLDWTSDISASLGL